MLGACLLRFACARGDLWLDEVWSLFLARKAHGPLDILLHLKIDNNHPLNTWILSFMPVDAPGWLIRAPACIAGGLTAGAAIVLGRRWNESLGLTWGLLFAFSYLMVHYSSEARGYAFLVLFCLLALIGFFSHRAKPSTGNTIVFFLATVGGLLSHATFLSLLLGMAVVSIADLVSGRGASLRTTLTFWAGPFLATALVALVFLRGMQVGGGNSVAIGEALAKAAGWMVWGNGSWMASAGAFLVALLMLWRLGSGPRDAALWLGALVTLVLAPAFLLLVSPRPDLLYPRYWLVQAVVVLLAWGLCLERMWRSGGGWRLGAIGLLLVWILGNTYSLVELAVVGRGSYQEALRRVAVSTQPTLGGFGDFSDDLRNDFRNGMLVDFYRRRTDPEGRLTYVPLGSWTGSDPAWLLVISFGSEAKWRQPRLRFPRGMDFRLDRFYPSVELSGWNWSLYQRVEEKSPLPPKRSGVPFF